MSDAERAEAAFWAAFLRNRNVDAGTAGDGAVSVAGGYALCVVGTMLTHALGAGSTRPLRADDCEVVEGFYAARGLPAAFEFEEAALVRDEALLRERGYADDPIDLVALEAPVTVRPPADGIAVRTTTDRRAWSELLERCIVEQIADPGMLRRQAQLNASAGQVLAVASIRGEDVGVGALGISGDTAILYSAGVLPAFRRRGVHGALVTARLGLAHGRGATAALLKAAPDSPAERSALRLGFTRTAVRRRVRRAG
jgi:GNAT superfamily N-acetyltransferase